MRNSLTQKYPSSWWGAIRDRVGLRDSPFLGAIHEGFVASEILKHRLNRGLNRGLYYFRDQQGLEVDFLLDQGNNEIALIEVKASRTPKPSDAAPMLSLMKSTGSRKASAWLVHGGGKP